MKRKKAGLIIAICICTAALISIPVLMASLEAGSAGYAIAMVTLCVGGPMLLIALFLCLFGQWKSKPYFWLPNDMAKEKVEEDASHATLREPVHKQRATGASRSLKKPLLTVSLFGCSILIIALFLLSATDVLGKAGKDIAFAVFVILGPMALIALCLSLFGQWKKKPYYWLPDNLAKEKMEEDAARKQHA